MTAPPPRIPLLAATTFLLMLPVTLPVPVLRPLVLERFGVSDAAASLFMAANMLGALLAAPLIGLVADRRGARRRLAVAALLLDAVLMTGIALAPRFWLLLLLRAVEGMAHIAALSLVLAIAADAAGAHRGRVLGALGMGLTLGVATGAAVGGAIGRSDPTATLEAAALCLLVAALAAHGSLPAEGPKTARPSFLAIAATALRHRALWLPLLLAFVDRFTVGFFTTGFPLLLAGVHGAEPARIGVLLGAFLYPFALLSYPFGRLAERCPAALLVAMGSLVYGSGTMLIGVVDPRWLWLLMPVLGAGSAVMFVPSLVMTVAAAPAMARSTAVAGFNAAGSLGFLLGPLCCGAIVHLAPPLPRGYALAFAAAGLAELACVLLLLPALRRTWRHRSQQR